MLDRFRSRFLTLTLFVFRSRNSVKYRLTSAKWLSRLSQSRSTDQHHLVADATAVAADVDLAVADVPAAVVVAEAAAATSAFE